MNLQKTMYKSVKQNVSINTWGVKGALLSFTLLLGACAATGDKVSQEPAAATAPDPTPVKESVQNTEQAPAPTAAQLMKTLKAPLVEPDTADVETEKPAPVTAVKETVQSTVQEANKKQVTLKAVEPVKAEVKAQVVEAPPVIVEPVKEVQKTIEVAETASVNDAKPFNVSASKLPFTYDIWTIKQGNTPLTRGLVIATPTWEMGKEGYMSQIWFTLMEDKIHVNSSSDIETASKGLGIRIDGGDLIPFTSIAENNIGVISGKWLDRLAAANKVDVYLGFFPEKRPTSDTFTSDLSLNNLARIVSTYRFLNQ